MNKRSQRADSPTAAVVGAGLAGLTAGYRLKKRGWRVKLIEATAEVGGRAQTVHRQGYTIDTGAGAMTTSYHSYIALARELGIHDRIVDANPGVGIYRDGQLHEFDLTQPVRAGLTTKLFSWPARMRILKLWRHVRRAEARGQLNYDDMARAAEIDDESARDYTLRELGAELQDYLCDPLTRVMLIADSDRVSKVELFSAIANIFATRMQALEGGVNYFAQSLADGLDVVFESPVTCVTEDAHGVEVRRDTHDGQSVAERFDACVVACPLPQARTICEGHQDILRPLYEALSYTSAFNVAIGFRTRPRTGVFAIPVPAVESAEIALLFLDHNKAPDRTPEKRYMISSHWENAAARAYAKTDDEAIVALTLDFLLKVFPELNGSVDMTHVARWPHALPLTQPGAYKAIQQFNAAIDSRARVQFAGDYMSAAGQNTAVAFGERAAAHLIQYHSQLTDALPAYRFKDNSSRAQDALTR